MAKIQVMDEALANKIAAGEVIERPASVVKELVENAVDAKAKRIKVEIIEGGLKEILVQDDGEGMDEVDLERAFLRHATSKINRDRDLFRIRTLGFRGEALPSIAAVAKVTATSRTEDEHLAHSIEIHGGKTLSKRECSSPKGTEIRVRDLFYNTPARLKYLKSVQTENQQIQDVMNRLAFSHPDVSFMLINEGRTILNTSGSGDLLEAIHSVYGLDVAKMMVPFSGEHIDFSIEGYIGKPMITRGSRNYMTFIVNGRYVKSAVCQRAVLEGYHTLLPINRYPFAVIHIKMDPNLLDVNVHPAKMEVRFSKEEELAYFIKERIRSTLHQTSLIPEPSKKSELYQSSTEQAKLDLHIAIKEDKPDISTKKELQPAPYERYQHFLYHEPPQNETKLEEKSEQTVKLPIFEPLAQLHGTYILAQNEEGLYLIDQHAAQERINYEKIRMQLANGHHSSQMLAIPYTFERTASEAEIILNSRELLSEVGINIEPFGERSFLVREIPSWFHAGSEADQIEELIELILQGKGRLSLADLRDQSAQLMACKASIKANQYLTLREMEVLLYELSKTENPYTCPHGRPVIIHFSVYEIEKMFKRVM